MKILMLTPYLPYPPSSGGQIRSYNLIKELSKKHQITLYSLIKYTEEQKYVAELEKYCFRVKVFRRPEKPWTLMNILRTGFSLLPFLAVRNYSDAEKRDLQKLLKSEVFDLIHAETFYVGPHIPSTKIPIILVDQAIMYQVYQHFAQEFKWWILKPLLWIDVLKLKYWEIYYWRKAAHVVAVSQRDASEMKKYVANKRVSIVHNPVSGEMIKKVPIHYSKKIMFIGNYDWLQNVEAAKILARDIFPLILKKHPDAVLNIVGQHTVKLGIKESESVNIIDLETDDIEGVVKAYHSKGLLIAPLYGPSGARVKIISAMAANMPVVTTSVGIEGVEAVDGQAVLLADSYQQIAQKAAIVLDDKKLYEKIAKNARKLIEQNYTFEVIAKKLDAIYKEVTVA